MRIAIACADIRPDESQGGIAVYTKHLARGLADRGHEVTVLGKAEHELEVKTEGGVRTVYLPNVRYIHPHPKLGLLTAKLARSKTLADYLKSHPGFEVVEFPVWDAEGWHATRIRHLRSVVRGHTPHLVVNELARSAGQSVAKLDRVAVALERAAARRAHLYLANSTSSAEIAVNRFGIQANRVATCLHGIPGQPAPNDVSGTNVRVLFVGRLEVRKGIAELFKAIPRILAKHPDTRFDIVGTDSWAEPGLTFEQLFERTMDQTTQMQVAFHGRLPGEQIDQIRRQAHIALLPSRYESFGLVHAEALSFGLPVVAFDISATREVVEDGTSGILVPDGDAVSLANAVSQLIADEPMRVEMGLAAFDAATTKFSIGAMAECVEAASFRLLRDAS